VVDGQELSIVIRTRNEEEYVGFSIQSILDHFGKNTHIIIVDNESTDETLVNVALFPKKFYNIDVISLPKKEYTPGRSLNIGIEKAKSNIVGILSAHCSIQQFDIKKLKEYFNEEKCFGVMGKQIPIFKGKKITPRYIWKNFQIDSVAKNPLELSNDDRYFFHNAFSFINKSIWQDIPFDEDLTGKEDRFWAAKLIERGFNFYIDPSFACHHFWTKNGATWVGIA